MKRREEPPGKTGTEIHATICGTNSDEQLLGAWSRGDANAGKILFERHFVAVARFFRNKIQQNPEDLIQRTFLGCLESKRQYRGDGNFRAYLFGIARNVLRRHYRTSNQEMDHVDFRDASAEDLGASPSQRLAHDEMQHRLLLALRCIPVEYQLVLELHYWEEMSVADVATVTDIPLGTAKTRIRRAKQMLAAELDETSASRPHEATLSRLETWARAVRTQLFSATDSISAGPQSQRAPAGTPPRAPRNPRNP